MSNEKPRKEIDDMQRREQQRRETAMGKRDAEDAAKQNVKSTPNEEKQ